MKKVISFVLLCCYSSFCYPFFDSIKSATKKAKNVNSTWRNTNRAFREVDQNSKDSRSYIPSMPQYEVTSEKNNRKLHRENRKRNRRSYKHIKQDERRDIASEKILKKRERDLKYREARIEAYQKEKELKERERKLIQREKELGIQ